MLSEQNDLFARSHLNKHQKFQHALQEIKIDSVSLETTPVFAAFWYFACERQNMFKRRLNGINSKDSSDDWILNSHRFTNTYRASDRVSQYLIRNVIWTQVEGLSDDDTLFRILLFKLFNRIDTWEALLCEIGEINLSTFSFSTFNEFLSDRHSSGLRIYSPAYIMPSVSKFFGYSSKHSGHIRLLEWMLDEKYPAKLRSCGSMADAYRTLLAIPSIGPFLAYQFATDINYSLLTDFSEMEFVVAGPGALDGISKCFVDTKSLSAERIIRYMAEHQSDYFDRYDLDFFDLWGRPLQLIDCQNIFCEISKYSRVAFPEIEGRSGRSRIKQKYKPAGQLPKPWYPPKWEINDIIAAEYGSA